ncbi:MAG: type I 3-dehydroquinate dehydratase, partial [Candidatus Aminicenantales bacterium]
MICVSLAEKTTRRILASLPFYPFAEIRLDAVALLSDSDIKKIFASHPRLIATHRPGRVAEPERIARLLEAVAAGAAYIDIEIETASADLERIARAVRARNCLLIVSFHNMKQTPARAVLED